MADPKVYANLPGIVSLSRDFIDSGDQKGISYNDHHFYVTQYWSDWIPFTFSACSAFGDLTSVHILTHNCTNYRFRSGDCHWRVNVVFSCIFYSTRIFSNVPILETDQSIKPKRRPYGHEAVVSFWLYYFLSLAYDIRRFGLCLAL